MMLPFAEALARLLSLGRPLAAERVPLEEAAGRVLAEDVRARGPLPPFDYSSMDGPTPGIQHPKVPPKPTINVGGSMPAPRPASRNKMSDMDRFRASRQSNQLLSSTIDTDHESAGVMTEKGGPYRGIFVTHAIYQTGSIKLKLPDGATRTQILYAATSRPPNGSCLEVGTAYTTDIISKETKVSVYVYDFCKGAGDWAIPPIQVDGMSPPIAVDEEFMKKYAGAPTQNLHTRTYAVTIFTPDAEITDSSKWYAQLFNQATGKWDTIYSTQGSFLDDERGWSIFETYFQTGLCSESLPDLGADELSLFNSTSKQWEPLSNTMPNLPVKISRGGEHNNNCFIPDKTGPASYIVAPNPPAFSWWRVISK